MELGAMGMGLHGARGKGQEARGFSKSSDNVLGAFFFHLVVLHGWMLASCLFALGNRLEGH